MPSSPRPRHFPFGKVLFALLAAAILVGAAGGGALLAYQGRYSDRIYPGVSVDGISLTGLDRAGATAALEQGLARYGQGTVTVSAGSRSIQIPFSAANRQVNIAALVDAALGVGRGGDTVSMATGGVRSLLSPTNLKPSVTVDQAALASAVAQAAVTVDSGMVDATVTAGPSGFVTTPAVDGSGLDRGQVTAAILAALSDPAAPSAISLTGVLNAVTPHVTDADAAAAVTAANAMVGDVVLSYANDSWTIPAATVKGWITFTTDATTGKPSPTIADNAATAAVKALTNKVNRPSVEATFTLSGSKLGVKPSQDGLALDVVATTKAIADAVRARATAIPGTPNPQVGIVAQVTHPKLATADAQKAVGKIRKVAQWTTYYPVGAHNGFGNNITIPAREISGTVVAPGATFDWWAALHVTATTTDAQLLARGYRYGGAILNGHSAEGAAIAGGICSASTTLFNAVARAGFQIDMRFNHYYFINRYPTGMDATVVYGSKNLQWTNDTPYPVLIKGSGTPGVVTFQLYTVPVNTRPAVVGGTLQPGRPNVTYNTAIGRKVTFSSSGLGNYLNPGSPITTVTHDKTLAGTVIDYPLPGFNVTVWRTVSQDGKTVHKDTWYSNYQMMPLNTYRYAP